MSDTSTSTTAPANRTWEGVEIPVAGTYGFDLSHSRVGFVVRHLMVSKVRGQFSQFEGTVVVAENPTDSKVEVSIDAASIDTRDETRDNHLRSADFFEADSNPKLTFASTAVRHVKGNDFEVDGDLTIHGTTKPVTLKVELEGVLTDPWGMSRAGFTASTEIDREDWGLTYNQALEAGGVVIGKKITIEIEAEVVKQG
jgi:polyisoprenoid-binding protein YceI